MRTQARNKRTIYICHQYVDDKNKKFFHAPIKIQENYAVTDTEADLIAMGMDYPKRVRIKSDNRVCVNGVWQNRKDLYHPGDRVYVYVEPPVEHDKMCNTADYEVENEPVETLNQLTVMLLSRSGRH